MARVSCGGWERGLPVETGKNPKPEKCLKNAARTHRQLHPIKMVGHHFSRKKPPSGYSKYTAESAGQEAVQSIGDTHSRSPALHHGRRSN